MSFEDARKGTSKPQVQMAVSAFWCLKMQYEMGKLMYQQNKFEPAIAIFSELIHECSKCQEDFFRIYGQGYMQRALARMGKDTASDLKQIVNEAEKHQFRDREYIDLVMDLG